LVNIGSCERSNEKDQKGIEKVKKPRLTKQSPKIQTDREENKRRQIQTNQSTRREGKDEGGRSARRRRKTAMNSRRSKYSRI